LTGLSVWSIHPAPQRPTPQHRAPQRPATQRHAPQRHAPPRNAPQRHALTYHPLNHPPTHPPLSTDAQTHTLKHRSCSSPLPIPFLSLPALFPFQPRYHLVCIRRMDKCRPFRSSPTSCGACFSDGMFRMTVPKPLCLSLTSPDSTQLASCRPTPPTSLDTSPHNRPLRPSLPRRTHPQGALSGIASLRGVSGVHNRRYTFRAPAPQAHARVLGAIWVGR